MYLWLLVELSICRLVWTKDLDCSDIRELLPKVEVDKQSTVGTEFEHVVITVETEDEVPAEF